MEISTLYDIGQDIFYLKRDRIPKMCSTCQGERRVNVTSNTQNYWNIECPDCIGKGKIFNKHYGVAGDTIKEVIARRGKYATTRYVLRSGMTKSERVLFSDIEEAEKECSVLNEQSKYSIKKNR